MADLTYLHLPGTKQTFLLSSLDLDPTVKAAAAALPASTVDIPSATPVPVQATMIIAGKALDVPGIFQIGGAVSSTIRPGAPESVTSTQNGTSSTVRATAPLQVGTPPYTAIVVGLDGTVDPNPVIAPTGEASFEGLGPGVYTPWAYAFGDGGVGPTAYGLPFAIAGSGTPPVVNGSPTIQGSATYASTLTVTLPTATGAVSSAIQWLRDGASIPGAAANSYQLTASDVGKTIGVRVIWTSSDGSITTRTTVMPSAAGKATQTASRFPEMVLASDLAKPGSGVVGVAHNMNAGAYSVIPSDASESHDLLIDGVSVALGTRGYTVGTWVPQVEDIGKTAIYRQSFRNSSYINDASWDSVGYTIVAAQGTQASVTITDTTPLTGTTPGVMRQLSEITGASADAGTSITITSRTDASSTGGVGVWELDAAGLAAYQAGTWALPVGGMVFDVPPTLAQGTTVNTGAFSAGTVALVFAPIGGGTYSYTLGLGATTSAGAQASQLAFDNGDLLIFNNGDGLAFTSPS